VKIRNLALRVMVHALSFALIQASLGPEAGAQAVAPGKNLSATVGGAGAAAASIVRGFANFACLQMPVAPLPASPMAAAPSAIPAAPVAAFAREQRIDAAKPSVQAPASAPMAAAPVAARPALDPNRTDTQIKTAADRGWENGSVEEVPVAGRSYPISPLYSRPTKTLFLAAPDKALMNRRVKMITGWDEEKGDWIIASRDPSKTPHANSLAFEYINTFITASRAVEYFERVGKFQLKQQIVIEIRKGPDQARPVIEASQQVVYLRYPPFSPKTPLHSPAKDATVIAHEVAHAVMNVALGLNNHPSDQSDAQAYLRAAHREGMADYFSSRITGSPIIAEYLYGGKFFDRRKVPGRFDLRDYHTGGSYFTYDLLRLKEKAIKHGVKPDEFDEAVFFSSLFSASQPNFSFQRNIDLLKKKFDFIKDSDFNYTLQAATRAGA